MIYWYLYNYIWMVVVLENGTVPEKETSMEGIPQWVSVKHKAVSAHREVTFCV